MMKRISVNRKIFAGFTTTLVLVILGLWIFPDTWKNPFSQPFPNLRRNRQPYGNILKQDLLSTKENQTFSRTIQRRKLPASLQRHVFREDDLRKQQSIIEKVKTNYRISCSYEDFMDTAFIKEVQTSDVIYLPDKARLQQLSRQELETLYHRYIDNIQHLCQRKVRLGNLWDGGWDVCEERKYRPKPPCIVYSFGIGNDFSFDDAVIKRYGCEVHSFDPTMKNDSYRRGPLNYFHATGIAGDNMMRKDGRELLTFESIRERLHHSQKKISIIKLDIEGWERAALPNMLISGSLQHVDNLAVEFHLGPIHGAVGPQTETEIYLVGLIILKDLYDKGFRIFWTRQNAACWFISRCRREVRSACQEVSFVRVNR